jgi:hypothetical protein
MFLAVARFELNGCFRTLICRYSDDQGMGKFAPNPPFPHPVNKAEFRPRRSAI